ncbi:FixH family protein [Paenibacillus sp. HB172176]|uniref:FixH family protein n=1 Tax=Paenibacillus sp. HB172176 TaxID=2493690 RepID=UPI001439F092|nr:FixH family protein [Paenibacillus sp. HB172176]
MLKSHKRITIPSALLMLGIMLVLGGCAMTEKPAVDNGLPPHISVQLHLPEADAVESGREGVYSIEASKNGQPLEDAETAEFIIWQEEHPEKKTIIPATETSPGVYTAAHAIEEDGLYIVKSHLVADGDQVMPAKRMAVGSDAVTRLAQLQANPDEAVEADEAGHHH